MSRFNVLAIVAMCTVTLPIGLSIENVAHSAWDLVKDGVDPEDSDDELNRLLAKRFGLRIKDADCVFKQVMVGAEAAFLRASAPDAQTAPFSRSVYDLIMKDPR